MMIDLSTGRYEQVQHNTAYHTCTRTQTRTLRDSVNSRQAGGGLSGAVDDPSFTRDHDRDTLQDRICYSQIIVYQLLRHCVVPTCKITCDVKGKRLKEKVNALKWGARTSPTTECRSIVNSRSKPNPVSADTRF